LELNTTKGFVNQKWDEIGQRMKVGYLKTWMIQSLWKFKNLHPPCFFFFFLWVCKKREQSQ